MWGPPKDVEGECNAHMYLGDDYGDNRCTMRCNLPEGHDGPHQETFMRYEQPVVILWHVDEKKKEQEEEDEYDEWDEDSGV